MIMTLYDTGVRAAELCGMKVGDLDWRYRTILYQSQGGTCMFIAGKASKHIRGSIGHKTAQAIERYLRKRGVKSDWLWLGSANKLLIINGPGMRLQRRFRDAGIKLQGAHAFRRGFAMKYLASGGQESKSACRTVMVPRHDLDVGR